MPPIKNKVNSPPGRRRRSAATGQAEDAREFPKHPRVGVGGVVIHQGRVLLIRRGREPLKGQWSIPGGMVELGEELAEAVRRELKEETGLDAEPVKLIGVFERVLRDSPGSKSKSRVRYHYVLVDYLCRPRSRRRARPDAGVGFPKLHAASDVTEARWVRVEDLAQYKLTPQAHDMILEAFRFLADSEDASGPPL